MALKSNLTLARATKSLMEFAFKVSEREREVEFHQEIKPFSDLKN